MKKTHIIIPVSILIFLTSIYGFLSPKTEAAPVKLNPDTLFNINGFALTNSMMATWVTMLILIAIAIFIKATVSLKPGKLQLVLEMIIDFFNQKLSSALSSPKDIKLFLPMVLTVFLLFLIGNQFALLPIISSITYEGVPLFKTPATDFSLPIGATLLILGVAQFLVITRNPLRHFLNFVKIDKLLSIRKLKDIPNALLEIFLGIMDIIGELAKLVSMSARLFGNVAAGELMVLVISGLAIFTVYFIPLPFIVLSGFSGLIQAFVFGLLAVQFPALILNSIRQKSDNTQQ